MFFVIPVNHWWGIIVRTPPFEHLVFSILLSSLFFVPTLELSIMSLIEAPVFMKMDPIKVHFVCYHVVCHYRSFEHRGVGHIESIASRFETLSSSSGLLNTFVIEWYINPSCESIGLVPHGLAMSYEDYLVNFFLSSHLIIIDIRLEKM